MTSPWRHLAACLNKPTDYWFPRQTRTTTSITPAAQKAIATCKTCPVATQCLDHAMTKPESHGIWGGLTAEQRRGLRQRHQHTIVHGTNTGYNTHLRWGEEPCTECRRAHTEYSAAIRRIRKRSETRDQLDDEDATA